MSLLNENPVRRESFFSSAVFKWMLTGCIFLCAAAMFVLAFDTIKNTFVDPLDEALVAEVPTGEVISLPIPPFGADKYNHGLREDVGSSEDLKGSIVFTALQNKDDLASRALVYHMTARNPELGVAPFFPVFVKYSAFFEPTTSIKPDSFFVDGPHLTISRPSPSNAKKSSSVQKYDISNGVATGYDSIAGESVSNLSWAEKTQKVAYTRLKNLDTFASEQRNMDDWEVVIADTKQDSVDVILENAVSPKWSPDGSVLLFLRRDGLYSYSMSTKQESKVVPILSGELSARSMIDVSNDGTHLLWSFDSQRVVITYKITSWQPVVLSEKARLHNTIDGEYVSLAFSPDGAHYALLITLTDPTDKNVIVGSRIEVYAVGGIKSLSAYTFGIDTLHPISLDAWITDLPVVEL